MKNTFLIFILLVFQISFAQKDKLSNAAIELTKDKVIYDPSYFSIDYPNGDVPKGKGVCTDVIIRAYRKLSVDLQKEVHLDMKSNFSIYPKEGLVENDKVYNNASIYFDSNPAILTNSVSSIIAYDDDMDVIILTPKEIEKIEKTTLTSEALLNARKWLILGCYTGQRGKALTTRIRKENFHKYGSDLVIKIIQKKGGKPIIIPVLPKVKKIYDNGLPYVVSIQKLNKHFKAIGKIAELNDMVMGRVQEDKRGVKKLRPKHNYISTHIGRRSFASNHYGKIPTPIIMKVTGHSKESTFLTYINQSDDSHIDTFLEFYKTKELKEQKKAHLTVVKEAQ